jgi:hypothetical protein
MNEKRIIWLVPVLVMALAMSACKSDDDDGVKKLSWSDEWVWTINASGNFEAYNGDNLPLVNTAGGAGSIVNGKMNFSIETPNQNSLVLMSTLMTGEIFSSATWDPTDTMAYRLTLTGLSRGDYSLDATSATATRKTVEYIYINKNCTINISGRMINLDSIPTTLSNVNLSLKQGWNAINFERTTTSTLSESALSINISDPSTYKWIYQPL